MLLVEQQLDAKRRFVLFPPRRAALPTSAARSTASGSTLQLVYQQAAIAAFKSVQSGMTVNYGGGGSGKGRTDLASGVVQFAGSDSPIPDKETANFKGKTVLYYPILIAPITVSYNLSGVSNLKLSGPTIAGIFSGKIKTWNDPAIKADNSGVSLPSTPITIAHRSDSSGTTANFSQFLVEAGGSAWTLGTSSVINWPATSRGGSGNAGVSQIIKSTPGAIGYVDYADAKASGLVFASIKNKDGQYVAPSVSAASAAASQATRQARPDVQRDLGARRQLVPDHRSVVGSGLPEPSPSANTAKLLQAYIGYLVGDGQKLLSNLGYAPLPANIDQQAKADLSKIGT